MEVSGSLADGQGLTVASRLWTAEDRTPVGSQRIPVAIRRESLWSERLKALWWCRGRWVGTKVMN